MPKVPFWKTKKFWTHIWLLFLALFLLWLANKEQSPVYFALAIGAIGSWFAYQISNYLEKSTAEKPTKDEPEKLRIDAKVDRNSMICLGTKHEKPSHFSTRVFTVTEFQHGANLLVQYVDEPKKRSFQHIKIIKTEGREKLKWDDVDSYANISSTPHDLGQLRQVLLYGGEYLGGLRVWTVKLEKDLVIIHGDQVMYLRPAELSLILNSAENIFAGQFEEGMTLPQVC